MTYGRGLSRWRVVFPLALLGMIFMRLVWMQLRTYAFAQDSRAIIALEFLHDRVDERCRYVHFFPEGSAAGKAGSSASVDRPHREDRQGLTRSWLTSVGYALEGLFLCREDWLEDRPVARLNQWVFVGTIILSALMVRSVTSNWTVGLVVAAMLLSRGRLLADLGFVSLDGAMALLVTAWLAAGAHFLRTGATISLAAMGVAVLAVSVYDRTMVVLCLPPVLALGIGYLWRRKLARPVIRRLRGARQRQMRLAAHSAAIPVEIGGPVARFVATVRWMAGIEFPPVRDPDAQVDYARGGLFRTIQVPFLLWVYSRRRWTKLVLYWLLALGLTSGLAVILLHWVALPAGGLGRDAARLFTAALRHGLGRDWYVLWANNLTARFDLHLWASLAVIVVCGLQSPAAGLAGFLELSWLTVVALLVSLGAALGADALDAALVLTLGREHLATALMLGTSPRAVVAWFEPALLSLGAAGVYNLMKVLDTRFADKT